jgi:hypothetical protein
MHDTPTPPKSARALRQPADVGLADFAGEKEARPFMMESRKRASILVVFNRILKPRSLEKKTGQI